MGMYIITMNSVKKNLRTLPQFQIPENKSKNKRFTNSNSTQLLTITGSHIVNKVEMLSPVITTKRNPTFIPTLDQESLRLFCHVC